MSSSSQKAITRWVMTATLIGMTGVASARQKHKDGSYSEPWGMAGCDLWSQVITKKDKDSQLGVWALRTFILNSQTSAITSGTSNCVKSRSETAAVEQEVFIEVNLASLSKEAAQGEGEHIRALAEVFGCPHSEFARLSQSRYAEIFATYTADAVLESYLREVNADQGLAKTCVRTSPLS